MPQSDTTPTEGARSRDCAGGRGPDAAGKTIQRRRRLARVRWTVRIGILLFIVGTCIVGLDRLFYYPSEAIETTPADLRLDYEDVTFVTTDGLKLTGWYMPARGEPRGTVIHFHGNAANIGNHVFASYWLVFEGFNLFVFDYRGYGRSEGGVTRAGTIRDGHAALDYVLSRDDTDRKRVYAFGQSLGGAVATVVAAERPELSKVVLDSTFSGYRRIASKHLQKTLVIPWLTDGIAWALLSGGYDPVDYVARISPRPLMVIAAQHDQICYAELGRELFDAAAEPKEWILLPRGRHLEAVSDNVDAVQQRIVEFLLESRPADDVGD